jgi:ABC-type transport system substrate-binding protein
MYKIIFNFIFFFTLSLYTNILLADQKTPLHIPIYNIGTNLDPGKKESSYSTWVSTQINCQLIRATGSSPILEAADSMKYINPLEISIRLKPGLTFSNNQAVTAYDVVASYSYLEKHQPYLSNISYWMDKIYATSDKDIIIKLHNPISTFIQIVSINDLPIYQKDFLSKAEKNPQLWDFPVTCGGYKVVKNDVHEIDLAPRFKGHPIIFEKISSTPIKSSEYKHFDIIKNYFVGPVEPKKFKKVQVFAPYQIYFGLNTRKQLWKNKAQRCELLSKLKSDMVLPSYGDYGQRANDLLPVGTLGYRNDYQFTDKLHEKYPNTNKKINVNNFCLSFLKTSIPTKYNTAYTNMVKQAIDTKNFNTREILSVDTYNTFVQSDCDAIVLGFQSVTLAGYDFLVLFDNNEKNFTGFYDKKLSDILLNSQNTNDNKEKALQYHHVENIVRDECVATPIVTVPMETFFIKSSLNAPNIGKSILEEYYLGDIN